MADRFWKLQESSIFRTNVKSIKILYHSNLNIILVLSKNGEILVIDVTSGVELHKSVLSESGKDLLLDGIYLNAHNKLVLTNGVTLGMRSDYNGILLFDTILQPVIQKPYDIVEVELPLFEALLIYQALKQVELPAAESVVDLTNKLKVQIAESENFASDGVKAEKWNTVRLKSTHNSLKWVAGTMATELKRQNRYIPALSIASAINERLNCLFPSTFNNSNTDRALMFSEANRRETFTKWPHMDYKWALPDQMAQAGFYHQPNTIGDDRAMCFTCVVCLVCWEPTDEPWSEHERHAPTCPFVRGEYTQNVPLSVNYATAPAITLNDRVSFGTSSLSDVFVTFSKKGVVTLYNYSRVLKVVIEFHVPTTLCELHQLPIRNTDIFSDIWQQNDKSTLEISLTKTITEHLLRPTFSYFISACSVLSASLYNRFISDYDDYKEKTGCLIVDDEHNTISSGRVRPCVVVAVKKIHQDVMLGWNVENHTASVETMNNVNEALNSGSSSAAAAAGTRPKECRYQLLLAVYDFHYKDADDSDGTSSSDTATNERTINSCKTASTKKSGTGTGTTISRNKDCEYYGSKIYETTATLLDDINLMETESHSPNQTTSVNNSLQSAAASYMFPFEGSNQLTANTTTTLSDQVESILSSTSTGTISPSEEKLRDSKAEEGMGEDGNRADGSKNLLKLDSMDLDKEAALIQHFCLLENSHPNMEVQLYPVPDGQHLLVMCRNETDTNTNLQTLSSEKDEIGGILLLLRINFKGSVLCLEETPVEKRVFKSPTSSETPKEFVMLPMFLKQDESYLPNSHIPMGVLLMENGDLHLINLMNLETVSCLKSQSASRFVSMVYCDHLEKLCVSDEDGALRYVSFIDDNYFSFEEPIAGDFGIQQSSSSKSSVVSYLTDLSKENPWIYLKDLKTLYRLTNFENVIPCYLANVPSCWNEVKQAQKQRRHPQLLQQGDSEQHTRSWKLQIGTRTWEEHIIELTLTQNMCIGHVDVKFSLHPTCQRIPSIQVTLLRLKNANGAKSDHDERAGFPGTSFQTPVNSEDFHLQNNTEILCGPVFLSSYLDLSKRSGTITLTSPKLFRSCCRTLLLHIKSLGGFSQEVAGPESENVNDKSNVNDSRRKLSTDGLNKHSKFYSSMLLGEDQALKKDQPATGTNTNKKPSTGCDWIYELSVTIRKPKRVDIPNERIERCRMLESTAFAGGLLESFCHNDDPEFRLLAMDILIWITSIRMCRYRSTFAEDSSCKKHADDVSSQQLEFAKVIEAKFNDLIQYGYIEGSRELAHKVTKLLINCSTGCKNIQDSTVVQFDVQLLKALVEFIPKTLQCWSAGAFRWFFQLLLYVVPHDTQATASQKCFSLLLQVAKELNSRQNPYHLLLRTRYGLYGNPFESELFDIEPIIPGKSSSVPVTYANLVAGPNIVFNTPSTNTEPAMNGFFSIIKQLNCKEFANKVMNQKYFTSGASNNNNNNNNKTELSFLTGISASHYMKGLLEVEPLHFTCHSTSDGTRVERVDSDVMDDEAIVSYYGPATATNFSYSATAFAPHPAGIKKTEKVYILQDIGDISQTPLESVMSEEAFHHFKMSVIPKIKQTAKQFEAGKPLIVIDHQAAGPSYVPTPIYHDKVTYSDVSSGDLFQYTDNSFPWQQLLIPPPQQTIIIDRMHSGAKRFVVLDFGFPICLTDMLVPPCSELLSLSIDIWTQSEEADGRRLIVASDIGSKMLIMSDIQPPPICRYLKITAIGRYGMSPTKCKIPIGTFYGHSYVLASDGYAENNSYFRPNSDLNVQMLCGMMEDVQCRYGLVCSRLRDQLTPFLTSEIPNVDHMNHYLNKNKSKNTPSEVESQKINNLYKDCITFQHQMNLVRNVINRISNTNPKSPPVNDINVLLASACTDKLRNLTEALLDLLLYFVYELGPAPRIPPVLYDMFNEEVCQNVFNWLCVGEDSRTQISTCTLLVRLFGVQPWWGEFLVNTFTQLYSSNYQAVFPQDRVFVLLSYLGRKSILSGSNQNCIIEHILKALLKELLPLADTNAQGFIRGKLDLPLLSWLLMFFLQCVEVLPLPRTTTSDDGDSTEKDIENIRWNFIQSEIPVHRKRMILDKKGWCRNFRRTIQKKVLQTKQLKELDPATAKKNFQITSQALSKLSSHALKLKQELQNVLQNIPMSSASLYQKSGVKIKPPKDKPSSSNSSGAGVAASNASCSSGAGAGGSGAGASCSSSGGNGATSSASANKSGTAGGSDGAGTSGTASSVGKIGVDKSHCLPVIRALVAFMLHVDITCNVDLFLISCKVMSCLLQISYSPIILNEILTEDQLLKLLQMAVWCENGKSMCGGKWTSHAITCLLQDIMDKLRKNRIFVRARRKSSAPLEGSNASDYSESPLMDADTTDAFGTFVQNSNNISEDNGKDLLLMCSSTPKCDNSQLPSLMESDDSETDDNFEEFLMEERTNKELNAKSKNYLWPNISVALDSRLEFGVEENVEIFLRKLADRSSCNLLQSVNAVLPVYPISQQNVSQFKMDALTFPWMSAHYPNSSSTSQIFSAAFDRLFTDFNIMGPNNNLEETLSLWLLLAGKNSTEQDLFCSMVPLIPVSINTISTIMTAAARRVAPSIRLWSLLFKSLTIMSNLTFEGYEPNKSSTSSASKASTGATMVIVQHEEFSHLLSSFLSSPSVDDMAGENAVGAFSNMLSRIGGRVKALSAKEGLGALLKERLLEVLCNLLGSNGAIAARRGPLDAQITFISFLQECEFANVGFSTATGIIIMLGDLVLPYVQYMNAIKCCTSSEIPANPASCFAPPALKSATSAQNVDGRRVGPFSRDFLMMQLLKFASRLLRTPSELLATKVEVTTDPESQTDESKSEQMSIGSDSGFVNPKTLLADVVLRHETTIYQFLDGLNSCYRSSLYEISDWHSLQSLRPLTNHSTVADGIYHFLNTLFFKSTEQRQKISIVCGYLSAATKQSGAPGNSSLQLSDPMLWLFTKMLNEPEAIRCFNEFGGVEIICLNLKRCFFVILNQHPSTVSSVMQYMYGPHGFNVPTMTAKGKKKHLVDRNEDGLINFAPLGTIILDNPAAQPADVLLMSATPHRRARSAAWSYHFYPEEKSVDLKILLPCAFLLKEVHLQPHHMSLATSPKAVSLEISRGGGEYIPIQAPVKTSGLAFLHMTLYQPEVVTSVLIRCYKPKESSGIGLSQIRLLGYSAFGDRTLRNNYNDIPTEHQLMNTATAWLRLYYHNLSVTHSLPDVEKQMLDTLATSPDTVNCICSLILLPSPLSLYFNRILAHILLKLGLHSKELCLNVIKTVLRNGVSEIYKCGKPVDPCATNSVFELLQQLCCTQDEHVADRVTVMLNWLVEVAKISLQSKNVETPIPTYVYCISCILWASQETELTYDLSSLLTPSLFSLLLEWSSSLPISSALKRAVDRVLCSMYVIKPENYFNLLENMSIIFTTSPDEDDSSSNVSDDLKRKQHQFMHVTPQVMPYFESIGITNLTNSKYLFMSEKMFATLATISQSHISAQQLIGCGFLALLVDVIIEFCQQNGKMKEEYLVAYESTMTDADKVDREMKRPKPDDRLPMMHIDTISSILLFFSELSWEGSIRTWLGSAEICVFWEHLLEYLCKTVPSMHMIRNDLPSESLLKLEDATIKLLSKCCWCYPKNQKTLAQIICSVICHQTEAMPRRYSKYNLGITDFTRRVLLQLVLETEKIFVSVETELPEGIDTTSTTNSGILFPPPPGYPSTSRQQLLYLNTSYTCVDIINRVVGNNDTTELAAADMKMINTDNDVDVDDEAMDEYCDKITFAAGVTAKDKRLKDAMNEGTREENVKKMKKPDKDQPNSSSNKDKGYITPKLTLWVPTETKYVNVCQDLTISQMLQLLSDKGDPLETPIIKFMLVEQRDEAVSDEDKPKNFLEEFGYSELPPVLKEFVDTGGLVLVAHSLPMVYPTHYLRMVSSVYDSPTSHHNDPAWVKLDETDEVYENSVFNGNFQVMDEKAGNTVNMGNHPEKRIIHPNENSAISSIIPPHSLMAFGQFLKLPNYAEWLIRDRKQAQCLLRLVLGGGDEEDFSIASDPAKSLILNSLPTLPFEILRYLFKSTPITTDDGVILRRSALDHGAIHVVLACLAIFTHQPETIHLTDSRNQHMKLMMALKQCYSSVNNKKSEDKSHQYWAKGTGFGTGSTTQSWNVEQALCRQRFEEEHVTVFLQILACYMNPDFKLQDRPSAILEELNNLDKDSSPADQPPLPALFVELVEHSCLLPALASYLRNDSVLDMARHIPLYRAILVLLRVMALNSQMVKFLLPPDYCARTSSSADIEPSGEPMISLIELLHKMKVCVDTYSSRLRKNKVPGDLATRHEGISFKTEEEEESGEGLTTLIPDIQATAKIVELITEKIISKTNPYAGMQSPQKTLTAASIDEVYLRIMKELQFDTFDMISEESDNLGYKFNLSYHFEQNVRSDGEKNHPSRMKRLAQEAVTLSTSLPLSYSSSVFVRCDTDRLDVMKVLITGPAETPYANGCFEFDVYFPPDYPNAPMLINLETTGRHSVRFNPNLYNDGKVCLSVLNTWHGRPEEKWNAHTSSFLQVLVSIQSLILVPEPYFNEPGYERSRGTASGNQSSKEYNSNIMQATVRWAMLDQIRNPSPCFKEIIQTHFWLKRNEITKQITNWINEIDEVGDNSKTNRTLSHGTMSLKCHFKMLCDEFAKLPPPEGLEETTSCQDFEYKPPSSPGSLTPTVVLEPVASTSASAASSLSSSQQASFGEIEKLMAELD
ncbi:baculoviral IAP repeat-containing protein 6-like isoform X3 [Planococcus citri]|uniref:baculoviral IAP repeat-containing protein 6-like isoform X3 n=1 Tax=Planococcus citri TaxID=170843 RepID=UPI0031F72B35